jgi:hypothetical protein
MTRLRLTLAAIGALLAFAVPASARQVAAPPCATDIVTAATTGTVSAWYSQGCYSRSVKLLGSDLRDYSDVPDIIALAKRRDALVRLHIAVGKRAPSSKVSIKLSPAVGAIRVSIFARKNGRFVVAAVGTLRAGGGTLKAKLGKATRIRVSAGYVGSGDKPVTVSTTLKR